MENRTALIAQLGERKTEDLEAPCSIHGRGSLLVTNCSCYYLHIYLASHHHFIIATYIVLTQNSLHPSCDFINNCHLF